MAAYTKWQNGNLFAAADTLSDASRRENRGAFFGSIHETLNHLLWGDQLWLHRLAGTTEPRSPDIPGSTSQHAGWISLYTDRQKTDGEILAWAQDVSEDDLSGVLGWYSGAIAADVVRPRWALVIQLFNHGTHHRGQVHSMLTAAGARPGDTDVPFMPETDYPWV